MPIFTANKATLVRNLRYYYVRGTAFPHLLGQYNNFTVLTSGNYSITLTFVWNQSDGTTPRNFAFGFCGNCTFNANGEVTSGMAFTGAVQRAVNAGGDNNVLGVTRIFPILGDTVISVVVEDTEAANDLNIAGVSAILALINPETDAVQALPPF